VKEKKRGPYGPMREKIFPSRPGIPPFSCEDEKKEEQREKAGGGRRIGHQGSHGKENSRKKVRTFCIAKRLLSLLRKRSVLAEWCPLDPKRILIELEGGDRALVEEKRSAGGAGSSSGNHRKRQQSSEGGEKRCKRHRGKKRELRSRRRCKGASAAATRKKRILAFEMTGREKKRKAVMLRADRV